MTSYLKYLFAFLVLATAAIWLAAIASPDAKLHLIACNVGEGDAILASYRSTQILVDGGPNSQVLDCLARHLPFWDREIEVVVLSHPQLDHYGGLIEVLRRYQVDYFVESAVGSSAQGYKVLKNAVGGSGAKVIKAKEGTSLRYGLMHLDILNPEDGGLGAENPANSANVLGESVPDAKINDYSIVATLSLGKFSALLSGDSGPTSLARLLAQGQIKPVEYIKIPHHGSKNGLTKELLVATEPKIAVISVGKNSYGHPHEEILKMLLDAKIKIFRTDEIGDIEVISDGTSWNLK